MQAADGSSVQLHALHEWAQARQLIFDHVEPIIYLKARFQNLHNRVRLDTYRTLNGFVYAKLIHDLWFEAHKEPLAGKSGHIVIDGIHFNSEGE